LKTEFEDLTNITPIFMILGTKLDGVKNVHSFFFITRLFLFDSFKLNLFRIELVSLFCLPIHGGVVMSRKNYDMQLILI
jgi:hypothetical protein